MLRRSFLSGAGSAALGSAPTAWSAEGTLGRIAFLQRDGLWIRSLPTGKPERLIGGTGLDSPRFSPTGKWIGYFQDDVYYVVSCGGGSKIRMGKPDGGDHGAQWAVDRDELLVNGPAGLRVFTSANGWSQAIQEIRNASLPIEFSPDGKDIVYGDVVNAGRGPGAEPVRTGRLCRMAVDQASSVPKVLVSKSNAGLSPCAWTGVDQILFWDDPDFSASLAADGLEHVAEPLQLRGPRLHDLGPVPDDIPGGLDVRGRDEAAPQQPALQQVHQPLSVRKVCFAARGVLDMPGVAHQHLLELPVLDQRVVDGHAVDPGSLHCHMGDPQRGKPPGRLAENTVKRLESALVHLPASQAVTGQPDRHRDHVLAGVNRGAPLIQDLHACQPPSSQGGKGTHAARRAPEVIKETDTRVRNATGGHPRVRAPASIFSTVSQSQAEPTSAGSTRTAILIHPEAARTVHQNL